MNGYAPLPSSVNGGYPDSDYSTGDYPDAGFPSLPSGSAHTFKREHDVNKGVPPTPLFPGNKVHGFYQRFGNINHQLQTDPLYSEKIQGHEQTVYKDATAGVNFHHVDPWNIHAGDVNLTDGEGYWAPDGTPRTETARGGDLVAAGPVTGFNAVWSGFVAQLRFPTAGSPGPVQGRIGPAYLQSVQASNAEVLYATQLSEQAINAAVFGG